MSDPLTFWVVWNPNGQNPRYRHASRLDAEQEAGRLARANPGQEFFVLGAATRVCKADITIQRFRDPAGEIPF
mgnify:CR=1 FL=1